MYREMNLSWGKPCTVGVYRMVGVQGKKEVQSVAANRGVAIERNEEKEIKEGAHCVR
jgi:hypothetical protein